MLDSTAQLKRFRIELLLVAVTVLAGWIFAASVLRISALHGRLATPPTYDDVGYLISGFDLFETSLATGIRSLAQPILSQHAPFQSILAMVGYYIFGFDAWSAYAVNGILLIGFLLAVLGLTRSLDWPSRLTIIMLVLMTPFTANLVAEFRPDLFWGVLCGLAVFLLLQPRLLDVGWKYKIATVLVCVTALHAKPSASPATALLLAAALFAAIVLRLLYRPLTLREIASRAGLPLLAGLLLAAPFFVTNASNIYNYIYLGYVTLADVFEYRGSAWDHAVYYVSSHRYQSALFLTLWIGLAAFAINLIRLILSRRTADLAYYLCYAAIVLLAYLIPTLSPMKSYFLGGIFYGTFLIFAIVSLASVLETIHNRYTRWALGAAIAVLAVLAAPGIPLSTVFDTRQAADVRSLYDQIIPAIASDVARPVSAGASGPVSPILIYTPAPSPMNASAMQLLLRWQGVPTRRSFGYYTRTLSELEAELAKSDYAVISEFNNPIRGWPGLLLSSQLLEVAMNRPDFEVISTFTHPNGLHTYLFKRKTKEQPQN